MNEVIIDGCNVAGCKHLWKDNSVIDLNFCRINFYNNYFSNGIPCCDKCNKHPDCYYKQLQRAKAEKQEKVLKMAEAEIEIEKLQAENEKLKKHLKQWHKFLSKGFCDCEVTESLREENEKLKAMAGVYSVKLMEKYKQALEDIKDNCVEILATIAEEGKPNHSIVDTIWCKNIPCCTLWELVEGMQREINEVLND